MVTARSMQSAELEHICELWSLLSSYVPARSTILPTALSSSAVMSWLELLAYRDPGCSGGEGGAGGAGGSNGGNGGGGGASGGDEP